MNIKNLAIATVGAVMFALPVSAAMAGDTGVRYLITEGVEQATILEALAITETKYAEITAAIAAEKAEVARVERLLAEVADKGPEDQARHLICHDVTDENMPSNRIQ